MKSRYVPPTFTSGAMAITLALTAFPALGYAQATNDLGATQIAIETQTTELKITWEYIVKLVDQHPRIAVGKYKVVAARAGIDAAGAVPNPNIEATTTYGQARDSSASRIEWGLELSIPFNWMAQRGAKLDAADAEARATEAESKALRRDALLHLRLLFWNLVHEQQRVVALAALNEESTALAATVRRRVEKGENRPVEATRVEIEAEKIAGELAMAQSTLKARQAQLGLWLGVKNGKQLEVVADLSKLPKPMSTADARARVRKSHPSIIAAEAKIEALTAKVSVERRARIPAFSLMAFTDHELDRTAYGVGLAVDFPLWNWNTGNIQKAEATLAAERSQLDVDRIELESMVIEVQFACQASVELAVRYRDQIQPRAESAVRTIERTYQLGEIALIELIIARRTLLETRTRTLATFAQAQTECSRLAVLVGEELP